MTPEQIQEVARTIGAEMVRGLEPMVAQIVEKLVGAQAQSQGAPRGAAKVSVVMRDVSVKEMPRVPQETTTAQILADIRDAVIYANVRRDESVTLQVKQLEMTEDLHKTFLELLNDEGGDEDDEEETEEAPRRRSRRR